MDASSVLATCLQGEPEHPVPRLGERAHLVYPPKGDGLGVTVSTNPCGEATFTVAVPMAETQALAVQARRVVAGTGHADGQEAEALVGEAVRRALLWAAVLRTGVFPFLAPTLLPVTPLDGGDTYAFQARVLLRPAAGLTDCGPVQVAVPEAAAVTEWDVHERISGLLGGEVPWSEVGAPRPGSAHGRMRDEVRGLLEREAQEGREAAFAEACVDELATRLDSVPPQRCVELLRDKMANDFACGVVDGGTSWEEYTNAPDFDLEGFKAEMTSAALLSLRRGMALDAYADHRGIALTEAEVRDAAESVAPGSGDEVLDGMFRSGQLPQLCESLRRAKAVEDLAGRAVRLG